MTSSLPMTGSRPPGREVTESQNHGLYLYDEPLLDEKNNPTFGMRLDNGGSACCSRLASRPGWCESQVLFPNGRCKKHGGKSLKGIAHPNWQHGRRSLV